ncbi:hypothetical protein V8G54_004729 [Vigna mungo]|uniref:Uncharacterized protein n=1 Tax=Vigna mungo TaxID=3915 RepID=A0AAQ3PEV5_VIGMU
MLHSCGSECRLPNYFTLNQTNENKSSQLVHCFIVAIDDEKNTNFSLQVYAVHFKCNKKLLHEYPNLFNYTKDIFQIPGISSTVNMEHIKLHYYGSHPTINPFGIVPVGPNIDYSAPHDRERFSA